MCDVFDSAGISRRGLLRGAAGATALGSTALAGTAHAAVDDRGEAAELTRAARHHRTRLALLGTVGGPTWYGDRADHGINSAVLVGGDAYVVDVGSGAYRQLRRCGVGPGQERAVFLTHLHSDHVIDLGSLLMYDPGARTRASKPMHVVGPGPRNALPPLAPGVAEPPLANPENPGPGTEDLVRPCSTRTRRI